MNGDNAPTAPPPLPDVDDGETILDMMANALSAALDGNTLGELMAQDVMELSRNGSDPNDQAVIGRLCSLVTTKCLSEACLKEVVDCLHKKCLEDRGFTRKFARFCSKIQGFKLGQTSFRGSVLDKIELDFRARGLTREKSYAMYLNSMVLLCEILVEMRLADGSPIPVLVDAALSNLFNFIDEFATEDSIMECCRQFQRIGPFMIEKGNLQKYANFILAVKEKLVESQRLSSVSRSCLLFILELHNRKFHPFNQDDPNNIFFASHGIPLAVFGFDSSEALNFANMKKSGGRKPPMERYTPPHMKLGGLAEPSVVVPPELLNQRSSRLYANSP